MKKILPIPVFMFLMLMGTLTRAQFPTGFTNININNIDAGISSSSDLFWNGQSALFEVPAGSGKNCAFAGGIWLGGFDPGGLIHMAGQTYRQVGMDFYPGPIDTITYTPTNFQLWDNSWKVTRQEVLTHIMNYSNAGYIVPAPIASWPGYNASLGRVLAPFGDYNSNGIYDPENGDYPYILGDMSVYSIFNDLHPHSETNCDEVGVEVHREVFGFDAPLNPALDNSIFMRYAIKNYSNINYTNFYITLWNDFDLGNAIDDFVGTDVDLDMVYCYNGDIDDDGPLGYGLNPPAIGAYLLNQTLNNSIAIENTNGAPTGNPSNCMDFVNYARSIWVDNQPLTYGNQGRDVSSPVCNYMYPDITDPVNFPVLGAWSEYLVGNPPGDRRIVGSFGPFNFNAGDVIQFDMGYTWARATSGGPLASITELQNAVNSLRVMYDNGQLTSMKGIPTVNQFSVYPNPAHDIIYISINKNTPGDYEIIFSDVLGKTIKRINTGNPETKIDVSGMSKGIYLVTIRNENMNYVQKLIKD